MTTKPIPLAECPVGLFWAGDQLCMKTEYSSNDGRIDAFIVSSREAFWGPSPQTIANQRACMVTPVKISELPRKQVQQPSATLPAIDDAAAAMRDHFAGQVCAAMVNTIRSDDDYYRARIIARKNGFDGISEWFASDAYKQADAMLAARKRGPEA